MNHLERLQHALTAGDLEAAVEAASAALAEDPANAMLQARLGSMQMSLGRLEEAVENLRVAAEGAPDVGVVWNEYGVALAQRGDSQEAERALRDDGEAFSP